MGDRFLLNLILSDEEKLETITKEDYFEVFQKIYKIMKYYFFTPQKSVKPLSVEITPKNKLILKIFIRNYLSKKREEKQQMIEHAAAMLVTSAVSTVAFKKRSQKRTAAARTLEAQFRRSLDNPSLISRRQEMERQREEMERKREEDYRKRAAEWSQRVSQAIPSSNLALAKSTRNARPSQTNVMRSYRPPEGIPIRSDLAKSARPRGGRKY